MNLLNAARWQSVIRGKEPKSAGTISREPAAKSDPNIPESVFAKRPRQLVFRRRHAGCVFERLQLYVRTLPTRETVGEIVDTQMAPVESSKSRYTCGDANPSAVL